MLHQGIKGNSGILTVVSQHHVPPVRISSKPTCGINGIHNRQRNVGDGLLARFRHFSRNVGFLRTESGNADVDLRAFNDVIQPRGDLLAHSGNRFSRHVQFTHVRIKERAIGIDPVSRIACATILSRGRSQLRVIPDGDRQDVTDSNTVFPVFDLLIKIRICLRFSCCGT